MAAGCCPTQFLSASVVAFSFHDAHRLRLGWLYETAKNKPKPIADCFFTKDDTQGDYEGKENIHSGVLPEDECKSFWIMDLFCYSLNALYALNK